MEELFVNKRIAIRTVIGAFFIAWGLWGCILVGNQFGYLEYGTPLSLVLYLLGVLAPAIAACVVLTKDKEITAKQLIKKIFEIKQPIRMYLLVIGFAIIYFGVGVLTGLFEYKSPVYLSVLSLPIMIIGGGLEEVGWRFVLNPTLERKLPFAAASMITSVIWTIWHLPLFFIEGSSQNAMSFSIFFIGTVGLSFAYAAIYRASKSVWLCVLIHALNNSLYNSFIMNVDRFESAVIPTTITAVMLIMVSLLVIHVMERRRSNVAA